jgi:hypothetical protein
MSMYRYRYTRAVSMFVAQRFTKHRHKLGTITKVVAKRYKATLNGSTGPYTTTYEVLMVYGTKGYARFSGVCWGYGGSGPQATYALLKAIGLPDDEANRYAFNTERRNQVGIDWEISLTPTIGA